MNRKPKLTVAALTLAATSLLAGVYYARDTDADPKVATAKITRGNIVETVAATGTLEAVTTVQVGSQVSGTVQELYADFNSIVRRGQVVARLEPSLFQSQVEQARANLVRTEADAERLSVAVADADAKLRRARELHDRTLIPTSELDSAETNLQSAEAQLKSAQAQVSQAGASVSQAEVNLEKTIIAAPIDGIVIARNVDVGQTVAASLQAPTVYVIAADLSKMRVSASIDESDVGRVQPGQEVTFRVDAFPAELFTGTVSQVRLNPVLTQNVVTYVGMIDVANPELKLKPGMTASVTIETDRRENVLRAPSAALRFHPTADVLAALQLPNGQNPPARNASVVNGRLWLETASGIEPTGVTLGLSDGAFVEIIKGAVEEGAAVVTSVALAGEASGVRASAAAGPFAGLQPGPPGGFGNGRGAGGAR